MFPLRKQAMAAAAATGALVFAASASAQVSTIDLLTEASAQIDGSASGIESGTAVGGDLDFDNDGARDALIGAPFGAPAGADAGFGWIVRGRVPSLTDLAAGGPGMIRIDGATAGDQAGISINAAGDVNGDGIDDMIVGADGFRVDGGAAYVVFGGSAAPINLAALGPRGFRIESGTSGFGVGFSVDGAGNVNGDEYDDLIVGAPNADTSFPFTDNGAAYVVFGKPNGTTVQLGKLGTGGYPINGDDDGDNAGWAVAGAGDVNRDGRGDQIVGAPNHDNGANGDAGAAYVVFGKANTTPIDLSSLGAAGYRIDGYAAGDNAGFSVDNAGDVNGNNVEDQVIGAPNAGFSLEGSAYIVHGKSNSNTVSLSPTMAGAGYEISGASTGDNTGYDVAGIGDVNGDGHADQVIGAPFNESGGRVDSGAAYVVFGLFPSGSFDLATFTSGFGYRADGARLSDFTGWSVAGAGDVSGSTKPDVIVGAPRGDANGRSESGSSYVLEGGIRLNVGILMNVGLSIRQIRVPQAIPRAAAAAGARLRYRLTQPAQVRLRVLRVLPGRRVGRVRLVKGRPVVRVRCLPGKPRRRKAGERACTRFVRVAQLTRAHLQPGSFSVPFTGRIGRRTLAPGAYVLELTARDRGGRVYGPGRARIRLLR